MPATYGTTGQLLRVNASADGLEFFTASSVTDTSIYENDGVLTANRTLDLGGRNLVFSGGDTVIQIEPTEVFFQVDTSTQQITSTAFNFNTNNFNVEAATEIELIGDSSSLIIRDSLVDLASNDTQLRFDTNGFRFYSIYAAENVIDYEQDSRVLTFLADDAVTTITNNVEVTAGTDINFTSEAVNIIGEDAIFRVGPAGDIDITSSNINAISDTFTVEGTAGFQGILYDADYSADYINRSLVDKEYVDGLLMGSANVDLSIDGGGTVMDPFTLVNDEDTPGNWHYYGIDGISNKGWHLLPQFDINRNAVPSSTINAQGGDAGAITETAMQDVVENVYEPLGLAKPGTIFNTIFSGASDNPTYQASGSDPYNPSNSWFWDGDKVTRIKELLNSVDLEDTLYGGLGTATLTPISPATPGFPTDEEVADWLEDNYTNNGLRLPNGALLYFLGVGTPTNPDFI